MSFRERMLLGSLAAGYYSLVRRLRKDIFIAHFRLMSIEESRVLGVNLLGYRIPRSWSPSVVTADKKPPLPVALDCHKPYPNSVSTRSSR